ncbi:hypothetical protein CO251_12975 [Sulfobacillus sp. hq2]|nr:hypothetical protein CO251_12975 [Sulfobacillus sp. hq2]
MYRRNQKSLKAWPPSFTPLLNARPCHTSHETQYNSISMGDEDELVHQHSSHHATHAVRQLTWALILTLIIFIVEFIGGLESHSVSVLSNALHLLSDSGAMALAYYAAKVQAHPPTARLSYGYRRSGILAALINGLALVILSTLLIAAGIYRLIRPQTVQAPVMVWLGLLALVFNAAITLLLIRHEEHDLNVRSMFWHAVSDAAGSFSVMVSGLLILWTHWSGFDPLSGIIIGLVLFRASVAITRKSIAILMEATPLGIDPAAIEASLRLIPGVDDVHHIHVWALESGYNVLSAHVLTGNMSLREGQQLLATLKTRLTTDFAIHHVTIQLETDHHPHPDDDCIHPSS